MNAAILLIAHGSRRASANTDLLTVAELLQQRYPSAIIEPAYLELAEPDIPAAADRCVQRGASEVRLLPWFLSAGSHVLEDLEEFRQQFARQYPAVEFVCCPPLGIHPRMIDVLSERLESVEPGRSTTDGGATTHQVFGEAISAKWQV